MYQLYYYPRNASLAPHLLLEEIGVEYELVLVDRKSNGQKSADYLRLNPAGRIPTLTDNELVIFESSAICLYLCEQNPESGLMPVLNSPERALFYQWLMYLNNTVQAELMVYFYPEKHTSNEKETSCIVAAQEVRVTDMFKLLDSELSGRNYLVGDNLSVCDFFLFMLSVWASEFSTPPLSFSNLHRYLCNLTKHQSFINVCKKENISLLPFS